MMRSSLQPGSTLIGGWAHGASVLAEVLRGAADALAVLVLIFGALLASWHSWNGGTRGD